MTHLLRRSHPFSVRRALALALFAACGAARAPAQEPEVATEVQTGELEFDAARWARAQRTVPQRAGNDRLVFVSETGLAQFSLADQSVSPLSQSRRQVEAFAVSRSGRWIASVVRVDGRQTIELVDAGTGDARLLETIPPAQRLTDVQWCADEQGIVYGAEPRAASRRSVHVTHVLENEGVSDRTRSLAPEGSGPDHDEAHPALSPAGDRCAVVVTTASRWVREADMERIERETALELVDLHDGTRKRLFASGHEITDVAWSPDGRFLAYVAAGELSIIGALGELQTRLCGDVRAGTFLTWSKDGRSVLTVRTTVRSGFRDGKAILGRDALLSVSLGGEVREFALGGELWNAALSPDGRRVAATMRNRFYVVDLVGGESTPHAVPVGFWSPVGWR